MSEEMNEKLWDKAEVQAEKEVCTKCLCPEDKQAGMCSACEVFLDKRNKIYKRERAIYDLKFKVKIHNKKDITNKALATQVIDLGYRQESETIKEVLDIIERFKPKVQNGNAKSLVTAMKVVYIDSIKKALTEHFGVE